MLFVNQLLSALDLYEERKPNTVDKQLGIHYGCMRWEMLTNNDTVVRYAEINEDKFSVVYSEEEEKEEKEWQSDYEYNLMKKEMGYSLREEEENDETDFD